jgi:hypothetical protein
MSQHFVRLDGAPQDEQLALLRHLDETYPCDRYPIHFEVLRCIGSSTITVLAGDATRCLSAEVTAENSLRQHPESKRPSFEAAKDAVEVLAGKWALDGKTVRLDASSILFDFQGPECLDFEKIQEYKEAAQAIRPLSPLHVFYDGENYRLFDGFHRLAALRETSIEEVEAEITIGCADDMERCYKEALKTG